MRNTVTCSKYILSSLIVTGVLLLIILLQTNFLSPKVSKEVKLLEGQCLSPEFSSYWPLDGSDSCMESSRNSYSSSPYYESSFSTTGFHRSCGFCGDDTAYLRELRDQIAAEYKEKCKDLVVYGAALGEGYSAWLTKRWKYGIGRNPLKSVQKHGTCFLQFITEDTKKNNKNNNNHRDSKLLSFDGSQHLVIVDAEKMPYKNNRRNTKVLKFNPNLLFPWADRVIWQDAKLLSKPSIPIDYMLHFNSTVQDHNTCSSFVGLPHHQSSTQNKNVTLKNHCDTIINAGQTNRPGVSDDISVVFTQCNRYEQKYKSNNTETKKSQKEVFHQNPLVETAFIVYDMRTEDCRKFNGDFGCSWLDEIHCYSDRDQVSFPQVLSSSGLHLSVLSKINSTDDNYDNTRDRVYVDENDVPKILIGKSSCHWYFENFAQCVSPAAPVYNYTLEYILNFLGLGLLILVLGLGVLFLIRRSHYMVLFTRGFNKSNKK